MLEEICSFVLHKIDSCINLFIVVNCYSQFEVLQHGLNC